MRCPTCNKGELKTHREDYLYTESGLPDVVLVGLEVRRCARRECGAVMPVIPRLAGLHRALAFSLARQPQKLRGPEIRFLRKYLGWSGADTAQHLHVSAETVSRWENNQATMGSASELLLRLITLTQPPVENYQPDVLKQLKLDKKPRPPIRLSSEGARWEPAAA